MHQKLERTVAKQSITKGKDAYYGTWNFKGSILYHFSILLLAAIPSEGSSEGDCRNLQHYPKLSQSEATILYHDKKIFDRCCWKFINGLQMGDEAVVFWLEHQILRRYNGNCNDALKFPEESYKCEPDIKNNTCWVYTKRSGSCTIDQIRMALAPKNLTCSLALQKLESTDGTTLDPEVCFNSKGAEAMFELHYFPVTCIDLTTRMTEPVTTPVVAEKTESVPTIQTSISETSLTSKNVITTTKLKSVSKGTQDENSILLSSVTFPITKSSTQAGPPTTEECECTMHVQPQQNLCLILATVIPSATTILIGTILAIMIRNQRQQGNNERRQEDRNEESHFNSVYRYDNDPTGETGYEIPAKASSLGNDTHPSLYEKMN